MLFLGIMEIVLLHVHVSIPDTPRSIRHAGPDDRDAGPKETPDLPVLNQTYLLRGGDNMQHAVTVRDASELVECAFDVPWIMDRRPVLLDADGRKSESAPAPDQQSQPARPSDGGIDPGPAAAAEPAAQTRDGPNTTVRAGLCAIVSIEYEQHTLLHWAAYHLLIGFHMLWLYVDDRRGLSGSEQAALDRIALRLPSSVTLRRLSATGVLHQVGALMHCQRQARQEGYTWIAHWDGDE